jgi:hypothetical protein
VASICSETIEEEFEGVKKNFLEPLITKLSQKYESVVYDLADRIFNFLLTFQVFEFLMKRESKEPGYYYFESEKIHDVWHNKVSNRDILKRMTWYNKIVLFWIMVLIEISTKLGIDRLLSKISGFFGKLTMGAFDFDVKMKELKFKKKE